MAYGDLIRGQFFLNLIFFNLILFKNFKKIKKIQKTRS